MPSPWMGLKEGIKTVLVKSLQTAFTDDFWTSLTPQMNQIDPKKVVMDHYPDVKQGWPLVRVGVNVSESHWGNISMPNRSGEVAQVLGKGTFSVDLFSLWAPGRDRLSDGMTALMLLREAYPGNNVFDSTLTSLASQGYPLVSLDKGTLSFGADAEGTGLEWEPDQKVYSATLSQGFVFEWAMAVESLGEIIREIDTTVKMRRI